MKMVYFCEKVHFRFLYTPPFCTKTEHKLKTKNQKLKTFITFVNKSIT